MGSGRIQKSTSQGAQESAPPALQGDKGGLSRSRECHRDLAQGDILHQQAESSVQPPILHEFGNFAIEAPGRESVPPWIQPKLRVGAVGDRYEQEADRVAQQVVQQLPRWSAPMMNPVHLKATSLHPSPSAAIPLQRLPQQPFAQPQPRNLRSPQQPLGQSQPRNSPFLEEEDEEKTVLQRKSTNPSAAIGNVLEGGGTAPSGMSIQGTNLESTIAQSRGSGQPLAEGVRVPMERAFGADFSGVRVHADAQSDRLNQSLAAKAFTTGQDIFFQRGAYHPSSQSGKQLIAHELTHVVQQNDHLVQRNSNINNNFQIASSPYPTVIQRQPVNFSTVKTLIEGAAPAQGYRLTYATEAYKKFVTQKGSKIRTILTHKLLENSYKNSRSALENEYKSAASTIQVKRDYFEGVSLSSWGQIEGYTTPDQINTLIGAFVDTHTYSEKVSAANTVFEDDLTKLTELIPKLPIIYQAVEEELRKESLGEALSAKLAKKLEILKKPETAEGMPTALKTKLGEVMGEINLLKAVTLNVATLMTTVQAKPTTKVIKTQEDAKDAVQELIGEEAEVKQFRANQTQIKEKAELFLAFFENADGETAALSESPAAIPADQPEIHQYYLNHPKYINQAIAKTIWSADYKGVVVSLWKQYKDSWLDALHTMIDGYVTGSLKKLKTRAPFDWEANLLKVVPPPGSAEALKKILVDFNSGGSKQDFLSRYEIEKIGSSMGYREVRSPQSNNVLVANKGAATDRIGYVINITTIPSDPSPQQIAQKYYNQGFDDQTQAKQRIGLVVGVNRFRSLNGTSDELVKAHANKNGFAQFSLVSFGFTWDFNWKAKTASDKDGFDGALAAYKEQDYETRQAALNYERANIRIQDRLPYAQFKERVTAHPQTRAMVNLLKTYNRYVYIHLGDADAVSLQAPEEQPTTSTAEALKGPLTDPKDGSKPKGIFSRYDVALGPSHPFMAIGGYEFRTEGTSGSAEDKKGKGDLKRDNLEHLLTYLANQLDEAIRIAIATVEPLAVYPTEPNLVFLASSPDYDMYSLDLFDSKGNLKTEGSLFGEGAREGRKLQNNLLKARKRKGIVSSDVLYDPRLSIATGSERFRLEGTAKADHKPDKPENPTYQERRKAKIAGKTGTVRKETFKTQIIEDVANQAQTFVGRALKLEMKKFVANKIPEEQFTKFTNRIGNVLSQKYIAKDKFSATQIEREKVGETDAQVKKLERVMKAIEDTLAKPALNSFWTEMNRVIDELYTSGYTTD